jgi:hypothetical protein
MREKPQKRSTLDSLFGTEEEIAELSRQAEEERARESSQTDEAPEYGPHLEEDLIPKDYPHD